jgi:hypothetical protein
VFGSDIPAGDGKLANLFLRCRVRRPPLPPPRLSHLASPLNFSLSVYFVRYEETWPKLSLSSGKPPLENYSNWTQAARARVLSKYSIIRPSQLVIICHGTCAFWEYPMQLEGKSANQLKCSAKNENARLPESIRLFLLFRNFFAQLNQSRKFPCAFLLCTVVLSPLVWLIGAYSGETD